MILRSDKLKYDEYVKLLKEVSYLQSELFSLRFNWKTKEVIEFPKKRAIFGRISQIEKNYMELSQRLSDTKSRLRTLYDITPEEEELLWWNVPYESVEIYLMYNLLEIKSYDNWRFEYKWKMVGDEDTKIIVLVEEGHCSRFSSESYEYKRQESPYSYEQKQKMIDDFNSKMDKKKKKDIFWDDGTAVKSYIGTTYDSITDYYNSWEYKSDRDIANKIYARSLYVDHTTGIKEVVSNSIHYKCVYEVGAIHFKNNTINALSWHPYELKAGNGDLQIELKEKYKDKSALIAMIAFINNLDEIKRVRIDEIDNKFDSKMTCLGESVIWAAVFTCIITKL